MLLRQRDAARLEAEKLPYDAQAEHSAQQSLKIAQEQSEKWESLQREAVELEKNAPIMETKLENARQGLEERQRENDRAAAVCWNAKSALVTKRARRRNPMRIRRSKTHWRSGKKR